jgi:glycosyltransferase involved in cell wall biosynthesis
MAVHSVVVLNDFCHAQGGASRVAIDEAIALHRLGLDVTFLGAVGPIADDLTGAGVRTLCLQQQQLLDAEHHPGALLQALWNRQAYSEVQSLLRSLDRRHTIVHLHGYTKALTTTPVLAAGRAGFTTICTLHDFFAACPNGAFFDYRRQQTCSLRALSPRCMLTSCDKRHVAHKAYRVARGLAQRHAARFPASVRNYISLSEQSVQLLRPYLPSDSRFHALPNIINAMRDQPVDAGANSHLVVVGRLDAEKGVMLAAEAALRVGLPIVFVGDGPSRRDVEATGARVTGWLTAEKVREEVEQARCLVFPSLWYETFGLVVDEAAARGVPAIVSDVSAPAERIVDGETGWLYPSGDIGALEGRLHLTRNADTVRAAGAAAYRRYWSDPSDPSRHAQQLVAIYEATLARDRFV